LDTWLGLVLEVCKKVPPVLAALFTTTFDSSKKLLLLSWLLFLTISITPPQPLLNPITLYPSRIALNVTARIAGLSHGTSPPPVKMPIVPLILLIFAIIKFLNYKNRSFYKLLI
jgi:hypothetical protein